MSDKRVWLITGASRGLRVDIARAALAAGHAVVATGRNAAKVSAAVGDHEALSEHERSSLLGRAWTTSKVATPPSSPARSCSSRGVRSRPRLGHRLTRTVALSREGLAPPLPSPQSHLLLTPR
jgi:NAD(P)-dependent dehydrogenase (short-subunit alcohol dehydrogenase family)